MTRFSRFGPALALLIFFASRIWIMTWPPLISDTWLYFQYAMRATWTPFVVYQDYPFGYPILGWLAARWPAWLDRQLTYADFRFYYRLSLFAMEGALVLGLFGWLHWKRRPLAFAARALALYTFFTVFFGDFLYDRLDLILAFSFFGIFLFWSSRLLLGLSFWAGFSIKLVPIGLWPFRFLELWRENPRRALISLWMPLVCIASMFFVDRVVYPGYIRSLTEHGTRGIQVESLWATPFFWEKIAGVDPFISVTTVGGADEIDPTVISDVYAALARGAGIAMMAILALLFLRRKMRLRDPQIRCDFFLLFFYSFYAWQRVLSPQFLIWAAPFLALSLANRWDRKIAVFALAEHFLTYAAFGDRYWSYVRFEPGPVAITSLRNLCIAALFILFFFRVFSPKEKIQRH